MEAVQPWLQWDGWTRFIAKLFYKLIKNTCWSCTLRISLTLACIVQLVNVAVVYSHTCIVGYSLAMVYNMTQPWVLYSYWVGPPALLLQYVIKYLIVLLGYNCIRLVALMRTGWICPLPVLTLAMQLGFLACISDLIVFIIHHKQK